MPAAAADVLLEEFNSNVESKKVCSAYAEASDALKYLRRTEGEHKVKEAYQGVVDAIKDLKLLGHCVIVHAGSYKDAFRIALTSLRHALHRFYSDVANAKISQRTDKKNKGLVQGMRRANRKKTTAETAEYMLQTVQGISKSVRALHERIKKLNKENDAINKSSSEVSAAAERVTVVANQVVGGEHPGDDAFWIADVRTSGHEDVQLPPRVAEVFKRDGMPPMHTFGPFTSLQIAIASMLTHRAFPKWGIEKTGVAAVGQRRRRLCDVISDNVLRERVLDSDALKVLEVDIVGNIVHPDAMCHAIGFRDLDHSLANVRNGKDLVTLQAKANRDVKNDRLLIDLTVSQLRCGFRLQHLCAFMEGVRKLKKKKARQTMYRTLVIWLTESPYNKWNPPQDAGFKFIFAALEQWKSTKLVLDVIGQDAKDFDALFQ